MTIFKFAAFALVAGASSAALANRFPAPWKWHQASRTTPRDHEGVPTSCGSHAPRRRRQRQSVMEACVRKAYAQEVAKNPKKN